MKISKRSVAALALISITLPGIAEATDFTKHLTGDGFQATDHKNKVTDEFGNLYQVRYGNTFERSAEVARTMMLEALGLPTVPSFPSYLATPGSAVPKRVTLEPVILAKPLNPGAINGGMMADWIAHTLMNYVQGNPSPAMYAGQAIVNKYSSETLRSLQKEAAAPENALEKYLQPLRKARISTLPKLEKDKLINALRLFLSRLDQIGPDEVEALYGPAFRELSKDFDFKKELLARKSRVRELTKGVLKSMGAETNQIAWLDRPLQLPKPYIRLPSNQGQGAVDQLWAKFFDRVDASNVGNLVSQARTELSPAFEISPQMIAAEDGGNDFMLQHRLHPENTKTVVFYNPKDNPEIASEVFKVTQKSGAVAYRVGPKSTLAQRVAELSAEGGKQSVRTATRFITVNLTPEQLAGEIDHPATLKNIQGPAGKAIEKLADGLGYRLPTSIRLLSSSDPKSYLERLPVSAPGEIPTASSVNPKLKALDSLKPMTLPHGGQLFIVRNPEVPIEDAAAYMRTLPSRSKANILMISENRVSFVGDRRIAGEVEELLPALKETRPNSGIFELSQADASTMHMAEEAFEHVLGRRVAMGAEALTKLLASSDSRAKVDFIHNTSFQILSPLEQKTLLNYAQYASNPFEITKLVRMARHSRDPRWLTALQIWDDEYRYSRKEGHLILHDEVVQATETIEDAAAGKCPKVARLIGDLTH